MGTRSNTRFVNADGEVVFCLYRQYDGYPSGQGASLKEFFAKGGNIGNGIPSGLQGRMFNGEDDMCAQLVSYLKLGGAFEGRIEIGGVYLYPSSHKPGDAGEEYLYELTLVDKRPYMKIFDVVPVWNEEVPKLLAEGFVDELDMRQVEEAQSDS